MYQQKTLHGHRGPDPFFGLGTEIIRELIAKEHEPRNQHGLTYPKLRQSKGLLGINNQKRFKFVIKLRKNQFRAITGLLTGHCRLNGHLRKMKLVADGRFRFCSEDEETRTKRRRYLGSYTVDITDNPSINPLRILEFINAIDLGRTSCGRSYSS